MEMEMEMEMGMEMEMEMQMDIPPPEELEWLESAGMLQEEEEEEAIDEEDLIELLPAIPDPPALKNLAGKKRQLPEDGEGLEVSRNPSSEKKRDKKIAPEEADSDEDWLRYSPPRNDTVADVALPSDPSGDVIPAGEPVSAVIEEKVLSKFASEIEGDCFSVTGPCGKRVYAKMSTAETDKKLRTERSTRGLILEPINALMERLEQEALGKVLQANFGSLSDSIRSTTPIVSEQLWVEKYAPNSFTELLSDERTNREVLLWLKQWDSCVFGSKIRTTTDDVLSSLRNSSVVQHKKFSDSKSFFSKNERTPFANQKFKHASFQDKEKDNLKDFSKLCSKSSMLNNPPEQKVLLLCGPPGLGKTTLAHVTARHCGYRVVEINASDDRSSSTIESKILDAVQMNSIMGDSKPKCLVIDEIDGALGEGKGVVEVLLKMVAAENRHASKKGDVYLEAPPGKLSSKKGHKITKLSRPVICICNDLYVPALRSLRQIAKVHNFVQPTVSRVVNRLKHICKMEGFKISSIGLSTLAEHTECDIRSCLNTLQFLSKKKEAINILDVGSQVVGRKDMSRSVFDVWKEVFQKKKAKHERKSNCVPGNFDFLYSFISSRGDYELTMDGIHENFLQLSYHDPLMHKTVRCLNVLGISDSLFQYIMRTQKMSLYVYQPCTAITMSYLISQVERPNIEWPKSLQRCRMMLMEKKDLLKFWHNKITPFISRHLSTESFVEDVVSPLLHILSPQLRPAALHLLTAREKDDFRQLIDTMVAYSITYKSSKPEPLPVTNKFGATSDAPLLSFDPPIDNFVHFKGYQTGYSGLSSAMKQVVLHEVEMERILQESIGKSANQNDQRNSEKQASPMGTLKASSAITGAKTAPHKSNGAETKTTSFKEISRSSPAVGMNSKALQHCKRPPERSTSFLDRFRMASSKGFTNPGNALQKAAMVERDLRPLLFRYNEGFTNAVKRPVRIRELLL